MKRISNKMLVLKGLSKKSPKIIMVAFLCCFIGGIIIVVSNTLIYTKPEMGYQANHTYDETLTVVARENFAPYSFVDDDGELSGYNIELVNLIANELEMNIDIELLPRDACIEKMVSGEADIICNVNYSSEFEDVFLLSAPTGKHRVVLFGLHDYGTIQDLYETKVARVVDSPVESDLHMQFGFTQIIEYDSYTDAFEAIMCGEVDYIIGVYAIINYMIHDAGYTEIVAVSAIFDTEAFALGIDKSNVELQQNINNALSEINNTGAYEELSNKWLGSYIKSTTNDEVIRDGLPLILLVYTLILIFTCYFIGRPLYIKSHQDNATKLYDKVTTKMVVKRKLSLKGTLMVLDINKFKAVNDTYGHAVGDVVIKDVADSLRFCTRTVDVVGRIGGDEFLVYLTTMEFEQDALNKATQIQKDIEHRTKRSGVEVSVSIGIAFNQTRESYETLFSKADHALYIAKNTDKKISIFAENQSANEV
ncbi:transporter substrate-binding domain-containing protein [Bengtsoniella intestinalis]|uniref:GGDEF domain-containing protein n=1 Tax=Bengtsoniella intestinalis TaxID=3073143 RepID=UPI00391F6B81